MLYGLGIWVIMEMQCPFFLQRCGSVLGPVVLWSRGPVVLLKYCNLQHLRCSKTSNAVIHSIGDVLMHGLIYSQD